MAVRWFYLQEVVVSDDYKSPMGVHPHTKHCQHSTVIASGASYHYRSKMKFFLVSCLIAAVLAVGVFSKEKICEPGETMQSTCGPCVCNEAGTDVVCENTECLSPFPPGSGSSYGGSRMVRALRGPRGSRARGPGASCVPGEMVRVGCNYCFCVSPGVLGGCTLVAC